MYETYALGGPCGEGQVLANGVCLSAERAAELPMYCAPDFTPGLMAIDLPWWAAGGAVVGLLGSSLLGTNKVLGTALGALAGGAGAVGYYHAVRKPKDQELCQKLAAQLAAPKP